MPVLNFAVKRLRTQQTKRTRWVEMGIVTVNTDDETGTLYLHDRDEDWKLYPIKKRQVPDKD